MASSPSPQSDATDQADFEGALRAFQSTVPQTDSQLPDHEQIRQGLSLSQLDALVTALDLDQTFLQNVLGISVRTLRRRRMQGQDLTAAASDRLWRLLHIWKRSRRAFTSDEAARIWLKAPHGLLGGEAPLEHLDTPPGLREVEDLLTTLGETGAA